MKAWHTLVLTLLAPVAVLAASPSFGTDPLLILDHKGPACQKHAAGHAKCTWAISVRVENAPVGFGQALMRCEAVLRVRRETSPGWQEVLMTAIQRVKIENKRGEARLVFEQEVGTPMNPVTGFQAGPAGPGCTATYGPW